MIHSTYSVMILSDELVNKICLKLLMQVVKKYVQRPWGGFPHERRCTNHPIIIIHLNYTIQTLDYKLPHIKMYFRSPHTFIYTNFEYNIPKSSSRVFQNRR